MDRVASVAKGTFRVRSTDTHAVITEKTDRYFETVSRSRVLLAPNLRPEKNTTTILQPRTLRSEKKSEEYIMRDQVTGNDDNDDADKVQCNTGIANQNQTNSDPEARTLNQNDAILETGVKRRKRTNEDETTAPTEEQIFDRIVDHKADKNRRSRYAWYRETLYRVRWYDCGPDGDSWEQIKHFRHSRVLTYCHQRKRIVSDAIKKAEDG